MYSAEQPYELGDCGDVGSSQRLTIPQYIISTKVVEQAKRNGMLMMLLANTNGVAPYKPFLRSLIKVARSSRTIRSGYQRAFDSELPYNDLLQDGMPATDMKARKAN